MALVLGLFILAVSLDACLAPWVGTLLTGGEGDRSEFPRLGRYTAFTEKVLNKRRLVSFM